MKNSTILKVQNVYSGFQYITFCVLSGNFQLPGCAEIKITYKHTEIPHLFILFHFQAHVIEVLLKLLPPEAPIVLMVIDLLLLSSNLWVFFWLQWSFTAPHAEAPPKSSDEVGLCNFGRPMTYTARLLDVVSQHVVYPPPAIRKVWTQFRVHRWIFLCVKLSHWLQANKS